MTRSGIQPFAHGIVAALALAVDVVHGSVIVDTFDASFVGANFGGDFWSESQSGPGILGVRQVSVSFGGDSWSATQHASVSCSQGELRASWVSGGLLGMANNGDTSAVIRVRYSGFGELDLRAQGAAFHVEGQGFAYHSGDIASSMRGMTIFSGEFSSTATFPGLTASGGMSVFSIGAFSGLADLARVDAIEYWVASSETSRTIWPDPGAWDPECPWCMGSQTEYRISSTEASYTLSDITLVPAPAAAPMMIIARLFTVRRRRP
jgi:hypothetical protein